VHLASISGVVLELQVKIIRSAALYLSGSWYIHALSTRTSTCGWGVSFFFFFKLAYFLLRSSAVDDVASVLRLFDAELAGGQAVDFARLS
jgi:hypothetical protein